MNPKIAWSLIFGAAVALPLVFLSLGLKSWAGGVGLGEVLGWGAFFWLRASVRSTITPQAGRNHPLALLAHSLARLTVLGLCFFGVIKYTALSLWAVLVGYMVVQLSSAAWQRWLSTEGNGVKHS